MWLVLLSVAAATPELAIAQISVSSFGAKCDWNGANGTDDTAAFNSAAAAANKAYVASGAPSSVLLVPGRSCLIAGTVTLSSGVVVDGAGTLVVPGAQSGPVLQFLNADQSGVQNVTIDILNTTKLNNPDLAAILWIDTKSDSGAHSHFFARDNTIRNGSYGISVFSSIGSGSLQDVDISGNTVASSLVYTNSDGIHVGGNVHGINIRGNRVSNRGDAAVGLTSGPGPEKTLSGAVVSDNICLNDLVGLDNSGGTNAIWSNNYVSATAPASKSSNPAARSMTFVGITPVNVKFIGNYLQNYQGAGTDVAAKTDDTGSNQITGVEWAENTIVGLAAMWLAANTAAVHDNYFSPGATILVEYDGVNNYPGQNIFIGPNYWMGSGTISAPGNPGLYFNNSVTEQHANGIVTIVGRRNFRKL
jgi:hypothetical protein